jgi:hypothetical protein
VDKSYCRDLSDNRLVLTYHDVSALGSVHGHQRSTIDSSQLRRHKGRPGGKGNSGSAKGYDEKGEEGLHGGGYLYFFKENVLSTAIASFMPSREEKIQGSVFRSTNVTHHAVMPTT